MDPYMELISNVHTLSDWRNIILNVRGPYPTQDSKIVLTKMIQDVISANSEMMKLKKSMFDLIYVQDLFHINVEYDVWNDIY